MTLAELTACCGSTVWADAMFQRQPFSGNSAMHDAADEIWWSLTVEERLEAFAAHPRIGQRSSSAWSAREQSGMNVAGEDVAARMARLNEEYFTRFGFIFLICASGKSASEMLNALEQRLTHTREEEIQQAAEQQALIMHLRLDKVEAV